MKSSWLLLAVLVTGCAKQVAGPSYFAGIAGGVGIYSMPVQSVAEKRFNGVVRQRYDFSCGSAALATLLRYHYDYNVAEDVAFRGMWAHGDRDQIRRLGFSLLDMKRWLASRGITADGYKVTTDKIMSTGIAGIALIAIKGYRHFVVVKGISRDEVLLGDPSTGLTAMPRAKFEAAWNGIYFVFSEHQDLAKRRFNQERQWTAFARAPVQGRFSNPVSQEVLSLTTPFYGDYS